MAMCTTWTESLGLQEEGTAVAWSLGEHDSRLCSKSSAQRPGFGILTHLPFPDLSFTTFCFCDLGQLTH